MKVVAYCRVSTEKQASDGSSLEAQRARLQSYAMAMDLELVTTITDEGYSAKSLDRPGIANACRMLDLGEADGLMVIRLDRLTRSMKDLWYLMDRYFVEKPSVRKCSLISLSDSIDTRTAGGRLVLNVLASISQWEREVTAERIRETLSHLRAQGVRLGKEGMATRSPRVVDKIRELYETGQYSIRELTRKLNEEGVPAYHGGAWHPTTVSRIVKRAA